MIKKVLALLFLSFPAFSAYNYTTPLIVNHGQVGGVEPNFPVLFSTNSVLMSTASAGGHMLNANGYDLVFSTWSDCHYLLRWDTETVNNTGSAQLNVWVNVPSLSNTTDTVFYACYGNAAITSYQGNSTGTWDSNFVDVLHMPNGTSLFTNDSTSNHAANVNNSATATSGVIDGAGNFTFATPSYIATPSINLGNVFTVEAWANLTSFPAGTGTYYRVAENFFSSGFYLGTYAGTGDISWSFIVSANFSGSGGTINLNTWTHLVGVYDGANQTLYVNGVPVATVSSGNPSIGSSPINIGADGQNPFGGDAWPGGIDEVRFSTTNRSSDWISTEYNNQFNPSGFIIFDTEVNNTIGSENEKGIVLDGGKMTLKGGRLNVK